VQSKHLVDHCLLEACASPLIYVFIFALFSLSSLAIFSLSSSLHLLSNCCPDPLPLSIKPLLH
jgi:hypothetical protein